MSNGLHVLISDIHANLPALEAVLAEIAEGSSDSIYHLGDLVGYGPWPNETIELLRTAGIPGVAGNYDSTVATDHPHCGCRADTPRDEELAHTSYEWTRRAVSPASKKILASLPFRIDLRTRGGHVAGPTIILLHSTPVNNLVYVTQDRSDSFLTRMAQQAGAKAGDIICFGHTHKPWHRVVDGIHFVNTGSVGRPKDGDPRACYVVIDTSQDAPVIAFVRTSYDIERTCTGILEAGLPVDFADFLRSGGAPVVSAANHD